MASPSSVPPVANHPDLSEQELSTMLRGCRERLHARVRAGEGGLLMAQAYSDLVDDVLRAMLELACERAGRGATAQSVPIAIVATGGYGRRELCPFSDIDITFVPHRDGDPLVDRIIKEMFTLVMRVFIDANGLEVGYAYRLQEDCLKLDHQTTCGLLDARLIAGSTRLFIQLENEFAATLNPTEFIFEKLQERGRQMEKSGRSPRSVEPNLKDGAGGLRDLQTAIWLAQAKKALVASNVRGQNAWPLLQQTSKLSADDISQLQAAKEFLLRTRNALHVITQAERDQLVVTRQEEVAEVLRYGDDPEQRIPAVEQFMRDYYRHASTLHRLSTQASRTVRNSRLFLGIGLDCENGCVTPANPILEHEDPSWMIIACELAQRYDIQLGDQVLGAMNKLIREGAVAADPSQVYQSFLRILDSPSPVYPILQSMADIGLLGWVLPEFGEVLDLIPYDPSHDYTVGQHTLHVIRHIDELRSPLGSEETRDLRNVIRDLPCRDQLYLAALLHDAGKLTSDRPHSESGEDMANAVCKRMGMSEAATANVAFLVRRHLLMDETSRLRDLNLDETIRDFATVVNDLDRLHMLYLLTYADGNAVGAGVWTQVKGRFLRELYGRTERLLGGEDADGIDDAVLARMRRRLRDELANEDSTDQEVADHVEGMPTPYLLNTPPQDMALHIGYAQQARQGQPVVDFRDDRSTAFTEVTICAVDDPTPGLLAKIAGVLYAADVDVYSAQVFTRGGAKDGDEIKDRIALDTLMVDFRGRQLTPGKRHEIASYLQRVVGAHEDIETILKAKNKAFDHKRPVRKLGFRNDLSEVFSVVEVVADADRSALYRACSAISSLGWDIHSARLSMYAGKQVANFYVTGAQGISEQKAMRELARVMPLVK